MLHHFVVLFGQEVDADDVLLDTNTSAVLVKEFEELRKLHAGVCLCVEVIELVGASLRLCTRVDAVMLPRREAIDLWVKEAIALCTVDGHHQLVFLVQRAISLLETDSVHTFRINVREVFLEHHLKDVVMLFRIVLSQVVDHFLSLAVDKREVATQWIKLINPCAEEISYWIRRHTE